MRSQPRLRHLRAAFVPAALALTQSVASAQFMNRAIWLGSEDEGLVRSYRQDAEYFIDRASTVESPPWWRAGSIDPFRNRVSLATGSVTSSELTIENAVQLGVPLGSGFTFRFQQIGSENQSTRYQRFAVGLDVATTETTSFLFQLEGDAAKARADVSFGAEFLRSEHSAHRFLLTLADWSDGKSFDFEYETKPYGLMLAGYRGDPSGFQFVYDVSTQLPFEERQIDTGTVFELQRTVGLAELRIPIGERDRLILGLDGELTTKDNLPVSPAAIERESADVERVRVRTEWWRSRSSGYDTSLGIWLHHLDEEYVRPNDPTTTRLVRRREAGLSGRVRVPLDGAWSLEPYVLGGYIELADRVGGVDDGPDFNGFEGKFGAPILFRFSDAAFLRLDLSLQLDKLAFGGGSVQFQASF